MHSSDACILVSLDYMAESSTLVGHRAQPEVEDRLALLRDCFRAWYAAAAWPSFVPSPLRPSPYVVMDGLEKIVVRSCSSTYTSDGHEVVR